MNQYIRLLKPTILICTVLLFIFGLESADVYSAEGDTIFTPIVMNGREAAEPAHVQSAKGEIIFVIDLDLVPFESELEPLDGQFSRPLALFRDAEGREETFVVDELAINPSSNEALSKFIDRYDAKVVRDGTLPKPYMEPEPENLRKVMDNEYRLVKVNLKTVDISQLESDAKKIGWAGKYAVSSEEGLRFIALLLRSVVEGLDVTAQFVAEPQLAEHPDGTGGFYDPETACGIFGFPEICGANQSTQANLAWKYLRYVEIQQVPNVAVVDSGFLVDNNGLPIFGDQDQRSVAAANRFNFITNNRNVGANMQRSACRAPKPSATGCWHGTGSASVLMALHDNQYGTAGVAADAVPMYYQIGSNYDASQAFRTAVLNGADVINISMAFGCGSMCQGTGGPNDMSSAIAEARNHNVPIVASAGNRIEDVTENNYYRCAQDGVICVGALDFNSLDAAVWDAGIRSGSAFGRGVDIFAPGSNLRIPPMPTFDTNTNQWVQDNGPGLDKLEYFGGTSASSPFVAGVIANMKAINPGLTYVQIDSLLRNTANTSSLDPKVTRSIDGFAAVYEANGRRPSGYVSNPVSNSEHGASVHLRVTLMAETPARTVEYWARVRPSAGSPLQDMLIAQGDPNNIWRAQWDVSMLPDQRVEIWAVLESPINGYTNTTERVTNIRINEDQMGPTGSFITPVTNDVVGQAVPLAVDVTDDRSGIDSVEYTITVRGAGSHTVPGDPNSDFAGTWYSTGLDGATISVNAVATDGAGNIGALQTQHSITVDHSQPTVDLLTLEGSPPVPVWITETGWLELTAIADDNLGVSEVRFTFLSPDGQGGEQRSPIGTVITPTQGTTNTYSIQWDVWQIPEQANRQPPYDYFVEAIAVDKGGTESAPDYGFIIGFDRTAPQINIVAPASGMTTLNNGVIEFDIEATDALHPNSLVAELQLFVNYQAPGESTARDHLLAQIINDSRLIHSFDTASVAEQPLRFRIVARDEAGNVREQNRRIDLVRSGPRIHGVSLSPNPFVASGSTNVEIIYRLETNLLSSSVVLQLLDSSGQTVRQLTDAANGDARPNHVYWDGRDERGNFVVPGQYSLVIDAVDSAGNSAHYAHPTPLTLETDTTPPQLIIRLAPNPFNMQSNVPPLEINWQQDEDARIEIELYDSSNSMIHYLGNTPTRPGGGYMHRWDLTDASGNLIAPGVYTILLRADDRFGNQSTTAAQLEITP